MKFNVFSPIVLLSSAIGIMYGCHSSSKSTMISMTSTADEFLVYDGDFHEEIIKPQVLAWQEVEKVMYPNVCDDIETYWMSVRADSLSNDLLNRIDLSPEEQVARLCEIQNVIACGIVYFAAIIQLYVNPKASDAALRILERSDIYMDYLRSVDFKDAEILEEYERTVYDNFGLFIELCGGPAKETPQHVTDNKEMRAWNTSKIKKLHDDLKDDRRFYQYSSYIDDTTFFMTYGSLAFILAGESFQWAKWPDYKPMAKWFDSRSLKVDRFLDGDKVSKLPEISTKKFSSRLRRASEYRTRIIRLLAEGITWDNMEN